jgi:hypothetical protein
VAGSKQLRLVIYILDATKISIGEEGRPSFEFEKDPGSPEDNE